MLKVLSVDPIVISAQIVLVGPVRGHWTLSLDDVKESLHWTELKKPFRLALSCLQADKEQSLMPSSDSNSQPVSQTTGNLYILTDFSTTFSFTYLFVSKKKKKKKLYGIDCIENSFILCRSSFAYWRFSNSSVLKERVKEKK